jgi:hypothetical protein
MKHPVTSISDLTSRQREFFYRFLRENPDQADSWEFEGYAICSGKYGLWDVENPTHSFNG